MLERMLTSEPADFRRYLKSSPEESVSQAEREDRGAFQYQKVRHGQSGSEQSS